MAVSIEFNPITQSPEMVITGFEQGISDSPELGIANMQNINNDSQPGIALCNYALKSQTAVPSGGTFTASLSTQIVTLQNSLLYGTLVNITGLAGQGVSDGQYYFIGVGSNPSLSGTQGGLKQTFDPANGFSNVVNITGNGSGIYSTVDMKNPKGYTSDNLRRNQSFNYYVIDSVGQVWTNYTGLVSASSTSIWVNLSGTNSVQTGNLTQPGSSNYAYGNGIQFYQKYLFVFRDSKVDIYDAYGYLATPYTWTSNVFTLLATAGSQTPHPSKWSSNNSIYYGDAYYLGSIYNNNFTLSATGAISSTATSATLTTNFLGTSGIYEVTFSDGEVRLATFTNANTSMTWSGGLTNTVTASILFSINPIFVTGGALTGTIGQNMKSLQLPNDEVVSAVEEPSIESSPGTYIYIGSSTTHNIYPWNKTTIVTTVSNGQILTTAYDAPLIAPEIGCFQMLNINKIVYLLMGQRGNIYYTNGSSIVLFTTLPKYPTGNPYSLWTWGGIMSLNNNIAYGAADTTVAGVVQNNAAGCWSTTLTVSQYGNLVAGATRYKNQPSSGNYNTTVLIPSPDSLHFYAGWYNSASSYGGIDFLDTVTPTFYSYNATVGTNQGSFLETEIIPIGTAINPKNLTQIEAKLDTALVAGEKFRIAMRSNLSATYVTAFEVTTAGEVDGSTASTGISIQNLKWVQFRADLQTVSGGSFVRLKEIRLS